MKIPSLLLTAALGLLSASASAQSVQFEMNIPGATVRLDQGEEQPQAASTTTRIEEVSGDGFAVTYRPSDDGYTRLEVSEPRGAWASFWDGGQLVAEDDVPTSVTVRSGSWYRLVLRRERPLLEPGFQLPTRRDVDARLVIGAAVFGLGWGLVGFCPGPALAALASGQLGVFGFVAALATGSLLARRALARPGVR